MRIVLWLTIGVLRFKNHFLLIVSWIICLSCVSFTPENTLPSGPPPSLTFQKSSLQVPGHINDLKLAAVDDDSLLDIFIIYRYYSLQRNSTVRMLCCYLLTPHSVSPSPTLTLTAQRQDVFVAWMGNPKHEKRLLFVRPTGVWASWISRTDKITEPVQVIHEKTLYPAADSQDLYFANICQDIDNDGLEELLLLQDGELAVYNLHRPNQFRELRSYEVPISIDLQNANGGDTERLAMNGTIIPPKLFFEDFNDDGMFDLFLINQDMVCVYKTRKNSNNIYQDADTCFCLGILTDEERNLVTQTNFEISIRDVDGNGKADVFATKFTTSPLGRGIAQIQLFLNRADAYSPVPDQVLTAPNLQGVQTLKDFNSDGKLDIAMLSLKFDLSTVFKLLLSKSLESEYRFYLMNSMSGYPEMPSQRMKFAHKIDLRNPFHFLPVQNFNGDFNGDGISDILVQTGDDQVSIYLGRGDGTFLQKPSCRLRNRISPHLYVNDLNGDGRSDLLFWFNDDENKGRVSLFLSNGS